ncbi:MAG: UDP-glucose/GDP-mannose dehydrogenase family protein [Ignavibacteria bacterium]|nr:UDP-glucose/GDP-mannose dehydrogenase family protein [Ignavibacteria bacterium]
MKLSVIGTGYVGLVVGTCLAETGNDVICVDVDEKKLKMLREGVSPIYEPGLSDLLRKNIHEQRLDFTSDLKKAVHHSEVIFLALPTPPAEDGSADLQHVLAVAGKIGQVMDGYKVIVNKSTVPVGTAEKVRQIISEQTDKEFDVVSNPEFLKEGAAVNDFMKPDRVVVGTKSPRAQAIMQDICSPFVRTGNPIILMDERSAEVTKYASNAFLATKISFMNELANVCERVGADIDTVRKGMGADPRIGSQFLFAGIGYGGSCFPKDVRALLNTSQSAGYTFEVLTSVDAVNRNQKELFVRKIMNHFDGNVAGKSIAIWGLSFKPNTDDMREAPALTIIGKLTDAGATVMVHDPVAMKEAKRRLGSTVSFFENNYDAVKGADALVVATEWNEFRRPDFERMKTLMRSPVIFDGRNIYDPARLSEKGFTYYGIGRQRVKS